MTQRRRSKKTEVEPRRFGRRSFLLGAGAVACVGAGLWLRRKELSERDKTEKQQQNVDNPALPAGWRGGTCGRKAMQTTLPLPPAGKSTRSCV